MNSELSSLQKEILLLCQKKEILTVQDILHLVWGWEPQEWGSRKTAIGGREYSKIHATLSRCLTRLWRRRLVKVWKCITGPGTAISLTDEGKVLAQAILADAENKES